MRSLLIGIFCWPFLACGSAPRENGTLKPWAETEAREFYVHYESALKAHRRDAIAQFYHPGGALVILDGVRIQRTNAGIDSVYRGRWQGPVFFAFDSLRFEPLHPEHVLVTGHFRWLSTQSPDTGRFAYLSVLERTARGLKIRVEHETRLVSPQRP